MRPTPPLELNPISVLRERRVESGVGGGGHLGGQEGYPHGGHGELLTWGDAGGVEILGNRDVDVVGGSDSLTGDVMLMAWPR